MHDVQPQPVKSRPVMGALAILAVLVLLVAGGAVVFAQAPRITSGSLPINGLDATLAPGGAAADASESPGESTAPGETTTPGSTTEPGQLSWSGQGMPVHHRRRHRRRHDPGDH